MTKVSVEEVSSVERRIKVEVEPEAVRQQLDLAYKMLSHRVKVPGFRPGKVPRRILEARYKDQVESDVIHSLVETSYRKAIDEHAVFPVAPPRITNDSLKLGEPFRYQAQVEVKPEILAKDYQGLELKKAKVVIAEAAVDAEIEKLRNSLSELVPVEGRPAQLGDFAAIDFEGFVDGKAFPGGKGENVTMELAEGEFTDGKVKELAGASVKDVREVDYTFPRDYRLAELAARTAKLKVTVLGIKSKKLPALDDELAKDVGAGTTLVELKSRIRGELEGREKEKTDRDFRELIIKKLIEKNAFQVPAVMIDRAVDGMLQGVVERFQRQGMDASKLNLDFQGLRGTMHEPAETEVRGALLLEAVAKQEKIEPTEEDFDRKVKELAAQTRSPEDKIRSYLRGDGRRSMDARIREEKTLAFIESKAKTSES